MPPLHIRNSETQELEVFRPITAGKVRMYTCGPTVYDYAHIGNLRSFVTADIVKRTLEFNDYEVNHTINFTDFGHLSDDGDSGEDKMMRGLKRAGLPVTLQAMRDLSDRYIDAFQDDLEELRVFAPTQWARASDYVSEQITLIKTLEEKGYTYETSDGVYFDISRFPAYGRLANINLEKLKDGARVDVNPEKKHPADFALWKKGLLGWDSKWGKGFPGWHVECSAMAIATLGKQIDIHTGGEDLQYTHHNAEIAQSECATGKHFVNYWIHSAFLNIDNTKISKSLGNTVTMRQLTDLGFSGDDFRYWLLTAHYRSPVNFTTDTLKAAKQALYRLKRHMFEEYGNATGDPDADYLARFTEAINNDFDTPGAISLAWEVTKDTTLDVGTKRATLLRFDEVLAIGLSDDLTKGRRELGVVLAEDIPADVQELIDQRQAARAARNYDEADRLREAINLKGYSIEDSPHGPKVTKV